MTRTYLVVFEKGIDCWGGFAPDISGTAGMGDTIDEARQNLREGIGYMLDDYTERGMILPEALSTSVDFSAFDPDPSQSVYLVEWMTVDLPATLDRPIETQPAQAA